MKQGDESAFPGSHFHSGENWIDGGMSLRDYFAAKAMQSIAITDMVPGEACDALVDAAVKAGQDPVYRLALTAYEVADAMLAARKVDDLAAALGRRHRLDCDDDGLAKEQA